MFDKQLKKQLEGMLNQMSASQKDKLSAILENEETLKNAISHIDPQKAQKTAENLNINGDMSQILDEIKKDPNVINKLNKNL